MDPAKLFVLLITVFAISVLAYLELKSRSKQATQNPPEGQGNTKLNR